MVKALQLAHELDYHRAYEAAFELRRLHEVNLNLIKALRDLVEFERGHDYHHDRVGALHAADMALNKALGDDEWPL